MQVYYEILVRSGVDIEVFIYKAFWELGRFVQTDERLPT